MLILAICILYLSEMSVHIFFLSFSKNLVVDLFVMDLNVSFIYIDYKSSIRCIIYFFPSVEFAFSFSLVSFFLSFFLFFFVFLSFRLFVFLELHLQHMKVPRQGVESEIQLLPYNTVTATWDLRCVFNLHHSSWQHSILRALSEPSDGTCILMDTSRVS